MIDGPVAGYTPARRDGLASRLIERGFSVDEIVDAGWAVRSEGGQVRDRFRQRVIFPMTSETGQVLGAIGRDLTGHAQRRYINSPRTIAFDKSSTLYHPLPKATESATTLVVCEGPLDALAVIAYGVRASQPLGAAAVSGTALTAGHAEAIRGMYPARVAICTDGDAAGDAAAAKWRTELARASVHTESIRPPNGADPLTWLTSSKCAATLIDM